MLVGVGLQLIVDKERNHEGELRECLNGDVLSRAQASLTPEATLRPITLRHVSRGRKSNSQGCDVVEARRRVSLHLKEARRAAHGLDGQRRWCNYVRLLLQPIIQSNACLDAQK